MANVTIVRESELRECVSLVDAVPCIEECFRALATGDVVMPPILRLDIHQFNGEVDVKTAYLPGVDGFAIKISPGFFDNPSIGLPSTSGMMNLFSAHTGQLQAVLLDNGYLTDIRTAAAGAVAAKWLSRQSSQSVALVGAGMQAGLQLEALTLVRSIRTARVWARDPSKAQGFADHWSRQLRIDVGARDSVAEAVNGADIVVTATPSTEPLLHAVDLSPGQHVTAMGSDAEHKNELHPDVLAGADKYFCDRISQVTVLGELHHATEAGLFSAEQVCAELGEVVAGSSPGRTGDGEITICDLTGTGAQDTAIATMARRRAEEVGVGQSIDN